MSVAGLVLAAGEGRRYGGPKAPVEIDGERLVDRAVRVLREGGCADVAVVLGAWVGAVAGADIIVNDQWPQGMGISLRTGLEHLSERPDVDVVIVSLVDLPGLTSPAVQRLVDCKASLAVATYDGTPGHPVRITREHWAPLIATLSGDVGAREYLRSRDDVVTVEVGDVASGLDLDEPPNS